MKDRIAEWTEATIAHWVISAPEMIWRNIWFEVCEPRGYGIVADDRCLKVLTCIAEYCAQDCVFSKQALHSVLARHYRATNPTRAKVINQIVDDDDEKHVSGFGWFKSCSGKDLIKALGYRGIRECPETLTSRLDGRASFVMCKDGVAERNLKAVRRTLIETHAYAVSDDFQEEMREYLLGSIAGVDALHSLEEFERRAIYVLGSESSFSCQRKVTKQIRRQLALHQYEAEAGRNMVAVRRMREPSPERSWTLRRIKDRFELPPVLYRREIEDALARET